MNQRQFNWKTYLLSSEEVARLKSEYGDPIPTVKTLALSPEIQQSLVRVSGIYFWVLVNGSDKYKVYIGKTESLADRVSNYVAEFQPHSPNDFKLRVFQTFAAECMPNASMELHFKRTDVANLTHAENAEIEKYQWPLLNRRGQASNEARTKLREAFEFFYRSGFIASLST
jgi:hypothetical protein